VSSMQMNSVSPRGSTDASVTALADMYRLKAGLSPYHHLDELTIGFDRLKRWVGPLLHDNGAGESLAIVTGAYGAGKTHTLQVARLVAARRGFATTAMSPDLGQSILAHPQRLVSSLIENLEYYDGRHWVNAHDVFVRLWADEEGRQVLLRCLKEIRGGAEPIASVAREAIGWTRHAVATASVEPLTDHIFGVSLASKANNVGTRETAYGLLGLWSELFRLHCGVKGLIVLLDEVETLFRPNVCPSIASRRAAYRAFAGFLGGRLERVRALWAITPDGLQHLNTEFEWQLGVALGMQGISRFENAQGLLARFRAASIHALPAPSRADLVALARNIVGMHREARGETPRVDVTASEAERMVGKGMDSPRLFARAVVSRLEAAWQRASSVGEA